MSELDQQLEAARREYLAVRCPIDLASVAWEAPAAREARGAVWRRVAGAAAIAVAATLLIVLGRPGMEQPPTSPVASSLRARSMPWTLPPPPPFPANVRVVPQYRSFTIPGMPSRWAAPRPALHSTPSTQESL